MPATDQPLVASAVSPAGAGDAAALAASDTFVRRHIGPSDADVAAMLEALGYASLEELIDATVPPAIRLKAPMALDDPTRSQDATATTRGEDEVLRELRDIAAQNQVYRSLIGMGYYDTITPGVIQRNILENPGWYTQYTPYQAEISQGRLEALLNFQTMVADLTGLPLANASLLDEGTAAAEAMAMCRAIKGGDASGNSREAAFFVAEDCHPQTIAVVRTRAHSMGIRLIVGSFAELDAAAIKSQGICGVLVQYPTTDGRIVDYGPLAAKVHAADALLVAAADLLALVLIKPPGEWGSGGADIVVGSSQRLGVPMGYGGPHAAFMATREQFVRKMPGRLVGVSKDAQGNPAYRLAVQTREQHIRRDKATSNICTAQVLLAIMAGMYAVYHGPRGLRAIARRVHGLTAMLARGLCKLGFEVGEEAFFDTLRVQGSAKPQAVIAAAREKRINLREYGDGSVGVSLDERSTIEEVETLLAIFGGSSDAKPQAVDRKSDFSPALARTTDFLTHPVFHRYHSETEMLRYIKRLESRDLSLCQSMISLGSCTMKLNGTSEMVPVTWPEFAALHPFAPVEQAKGYARLFADLEQWLARITGFAATSLQPNAGSQGEYAGLLAIRGYHESRGDKHRDLCLIPVSAHGTNPASAVIAGFRVVPVECDSDGNIDIGDLQAKAAEHADKLGALMITYPSTHGVFEQGVRDICRIVHQHGGQVYMDGANMNAQVGLCSPGDIGADVCHLNLHKTFCIPHGGGGPGMGPICVAEHLRTFLPSAEAKPQAVNQRFVISSAPYGSPSILPISWVYIRLMGAAGLMRATQVAILNANYIARQLQGHYDTLYRGRNGRVAHECIVDCRAFEHSAGVRVEDIAKRLMDYGFHAPTMSWPVPGTLMIEPTESECKAELDRFCAAMIAIRHEIRAIEEGRSDRADNALKHAPHTALAIAADDWAHAYSRRQAAYPTAQQAQFKFWPAAGRIDNAWGDRHLACTCPPMASYQD
ncbi:MAG: aminomethyl-transferring glycine dehydrogenase [Phycisphaeraceae bacterium]